MSFSLITGINIFTSYNRILLGFTGFYWVLLGFTGFYSLSLSLCSQLVRHLLWRRVFFLARWWESTKAPPAACRYHIGVGYCQATHSDAGDGQAKTEKKNLTFEPPPKNKTKWPGRGRDRRHLLQCVCVCVCVCVWPHPVLFDIIEHFLIGYFFFFFFFFFFFSAVFECCCRVVVVVVVVVVVKWVGHAQVAQDASAIGAHRVRCVWVSLSCSQVA